MSIALCFAKYFGLPTMNGPVTSKWFSFGLIEYAASIDLGELYKQSSRNRLFLHDHSPDVAIHERRILGGQVTSHRSDAVGGTASRVIVLFLLSLTPVPLLQQLGSVSSHQLRCMHLVLFFWSQLVQFDATY